MRVTKITIEVQEIENENTNPFIEEGIKIQENLALDKKFNEFNNKVKGLQLNVLSKIKSELISNLIEAKIDFTTNKVFNQLTDVELRLPFKPLYKYAWFTIIVYGKTLIVKLTPNVNEANNRIMLSGGYTLSLSTKGDYSSMTLERTLEWENFDSINDLKKVLLSFIKNK